MKGELKLYVPLGERTQENQIVTVQFLMISPRDTPTKQFLAVQMQVLFTKGRVFLYFFAGTAFTTRYLQRSNRTLIIITAPKATKRSGIAISS